MTVLGGDYSDHQPNLSKGDVATLDFAIGKLYPGGGWTKDTFVPATIDVPLRGFYAADVTKTWSQAKAALAAVGADPAKDAYAVDLLEFGVSNAAMRAHIAAAKKDGWVVGLYASEGNWPGDLGQDWNWVAHYGIFPKRPSIGHIMFQYNDGKTGAHGGGDLDLSDLALDVLRTLTTKGAPDMALDPKTDAKVFDDMLAERIVNAGWVSGVVEGVKAHEDGEAFDPAWGAWKRAGYQAATAGSPGPIAPFDATITPK